jgi:hypothetical protein
LIKETPRAGTRPPALGNRHWECSSALAAPSPNLEEPEPGPRRFYAHRYPGVVREVHRDHGAKRRPKSLLGAPKSTHKQRGMVVERKKDGGREAGAG